MPDWNRCAVDHANYVRNSSCIERSVGGLIVLGPDGSPSLPAMAEVEGLGVKAYFGCRGYRNDPAVRAEVRLLRRLCVLKGVEELAFAPDSRDGRSWALIVRTEEATDTLAKMLLVVQALAGKKGGASLTAIDTEYLQDLEVDVEELLKG